MTTDDLPPLTHAGPGKDTDDRRDRVCRCAECGHQAQSSIVNDFYGEDGEPLLCERCICNEVAIKKHQPGRLP